MFSGELCGPRPPLGAQMGGEAQPLLVLSLPGLTRGQRWRNKKNKDQVILQAAWLAGGAALPCPWPLQPFILSEHTQQSELYGPVPLTATKQTAGRTTETD